jgi:hypothetical protein
MPMMFVARVAGLIAAFGLSVALGNLIGGFVPSNNVTAAISPSIDVALASSCETIRAPSDSGIELLAYGAFMIMPAFQTADAPSTAKEVAPAKVAPSPPKVTPRPQRRAPVRYASRDADDGE